MFRKSGTYGFMRGPPRLPIKNDINHKDLINPVRYAPAYLLDLAAVRLYLDIKNDKGDLNASSIFIVGAEPRVADFLKRERAAVAADREMLSEMLPFRKGERQA